MAAKIFRMDRILYRKSSFDQELKSESYRIEEPNMSFTTSDRDKRS